MYTKKKKPRDESTGGGGGKTFRSHSVRRARARGREPEDPERPGSYDDGLSACRGCCPSRLLRKPRHATCCRRRRTRTHVTIFFFFFFYGTGVKTVVVVVIVVRRSDRASITAPEQRRTRAGGNGPRGRRRYPGALRTLPWYTHTRTHTSGIAAVHYKHCAAAA